MRTWIVSFWTFVAARNADDVLLGPVAISVVITLLSLPASVLGNEAALRFGRHRAIRYIMFLSAAIAVAIGLALRCLQSSFCCYLLVYGFHRSGRFRCAHLGDECKRKSSTTGRDDGTTFDGRIWAVCARSLGDGRSFGFGGRTNQRLGMAGSVFVACRGYPAWTGCAVVVRAKFFRA